MAALAHTFERRELGELMYLRVCHLGAFVEEIYFNRGVYVLDALGELRFGGPDQIPRRGPCHPRKLVWFRTIRRLFNIRKDFGQLLDIGYYSRRFPALAEHALLNHEFTNGPRVLYDCRKSALVLEGGAYQIAPEGIRG